MNDEEINKKLERLEKILKLHKESNHKDIINKRNAEYNKIRMKTSEKAREASRKNAIGYYEKNKALVLERKKQRYHEKKKLALVEV